MDIRIERWHSILLGSLFALGGMAGYVASLMRAGTNASPLDGFAGQSLLGSASAAALVIGVLLWFLGNLSALQDLAGQTGHHAD